MNGLEVWVYGLKGRLSVSVIEFRLVWIQLRELGYVQNSTEMDASEISSCAAWKKKRTRGSVVLLLLL